MASTNKTTNYELSQFEGTDKPSWEADYNADMLAIDTNLKAVSDVADGASGSISTLADRVTTAEGNITTNANDIDALEARADALEAGQTSDDSRLDALEAEQIVQNTAIEGNTQLGYNIARPYDSASTYSLDDYALFQNTLYKCTTAVTTGEAFDPTKWEAIKVTDEFSSGSTTATLLKDDNLLTFGTPNGTGATIGSLVPITRELYKIGNLRILNLAVTLQTVSMTATGEPAQIVFDIPLTFVESISLPAVSNYAFSFDMKFQKGNFSTKRAQINRTQNLLLFDIVQVSHPSDSQQLSFYCSLIWLE